MSVNHETRRLLSVIIISVAVILSGMAYAHADSSVSAISGRLAAKYDSQSGTVTAMVAGYCESQPVTIGPSTWKVAEWEFANMNAADIARTLCGEKHTLQRVTKSSNNGREIVADIVMVRNKPEGLAGR